MEGEAAARIRLVRCPRCDKFLPELPAYSVYICGGCGAALQGASLPLSFHLFPLNEGIILEQNLVSIAQHRKWIVFG